MVIDLVIVIAFIWLIAASFTDLKKREVSDWLSFSLIVIVLSIKTTESIIQKNPAPILTSLFGLFIFLIISLLMYYGKLFAGGDVKLLTALGTVIPSIAFLSNILIAGSIYGIIYSVILASLNFKEFSSEIKKNKEIFKPFMILFMILLIGYIFTSNLLLLLILISSSLIIIVFIFINSVEKSCLIKGVSSEKLTEGDWLLKDVKVRGKTIKANFEGLTKKEIEIIKKYGKKVYVKYGIPFVPVFLFALILTILFGNVFALFI